MANYHQPHTTLIKIHGTQMIQQWLEQHNIDIKTLPNLLEKYQQTDIDFSDWYFEYKQSQSLCIENGVLKDAAHTFNEGVGVRAIVYDQTGFSYSNTISAQAIEKACIFAKKIARYGNENKQIVATPPPPIKQSIYPAINPINQLSLKQSAAILQSIESSIRQKSEHVVHTKASINLSIKMKVIVATDGTFETDISPLCSLHVYLVMSKNGRQETGFAAMGGRFDPSEHFNQAEKINQVVENALKQAQINLEAKDAPAGQMPVVLGPGWPGVLLHEAIGHGLEADFHYKKTSVYTDCLGKMIASPLCTIVDNGTIANRRGSLNIDDEGVSTTQNVLIENGKLCNLMYDKQSAMLLKKASTGNGRRQSYAHLPMPRMTNTYMLAGQSAHEEIIQSVDRGVYASNFSGGQVDITSGQFVFSACEAYWIEKGKIQYPIKGMTLIGKGSEVLKKISMVGNNLALDSGIGMCGKEGQSVPVGVGQPTLKIDAMTVGGTRV